MKYFVFLLGLMIPTTGFAASSHAPHYHDCVHDHTPAVTYYIGHGSHHHFGYGYGVHKYKRIHVHKHYNKKLYKKKYKKSYKKKYYNRY